MLPFLELKSLLAILPIKTIDGVIKWCHRSDINIEFFGGKRVVRKFLVEMELDKGLVKSLKQKYPYRWRELYRCYRDKDRIGYLLLLDENLEMDIRPPMVRRSNMSKLALEFSRT